MNIIKEIFAEFPDTSAKIRGRLGATGSGKTLDQTEQDVLPALLAGEQVWCSYWVNWAGENLHYFPPADFETIARVRNATIVFDEIRQSFDPRSWEAESNEVRAFFELHRKRHNDIIFNTQDVSLVAKTVGIQAHEWSRIERVSDGLLVRIFYNLMGWQGITVRKDYLSFAELKKMANGWELGEDVALDAEWKLTHYRAQNLIHRELNDFKVELFHRYCPKCQARQGEQILKKDTAKVVGFDNKKGLPILRQKEFCPKHKDILLEVRESGIYDTDFEPEVKEKDIQVKILTECPKGDRLIPYYGALSQRQQELIAELNKTAGISG